MTLSLATWNINGVKARLEAATAWLAEAKPDIACLQEIKSVDDAFPRFEFEALGYNVATHGEKGFNGVAILSRLPLEEVAAGLPGADDDQARYLQAVVSTQGGALRFASIYLPNGNPPDTDKFTYKLRWMDRLIDHARALLALEEPLVLAGDYNVIPGAQDVWDATRWTGDALFRPEVRGRFRALAALGLTEAFRSCDWRAGQYSFWDYQAGAWQKDQGLRIDHLLLSPQAADRLVCCRIDKVVRGREKPSDHVPVVAELDL
jgi:exodeoxyribonuclease-3